MENQNKILQEKRRQAQLILDNDRQIWHQTQRLSRLQNTIHTTSSMVEFSRNLLSGTDDVSLAKMESHLEYMAVELVKISQTVTAIWMNQPPTGWEQVHYCEDNDIDPDSLADFDYDSDRNELQHDSCYKKLQDLGLSEPIEFIDEEEDDDERHFKDPDNTLNPTF